MMEIENKRCRMESGRRRIIDRGWLMMDEAGDRGWSVNQRG
jgi:hypothetical protein